MATSCTRVYVRVMMTIIVRFAKMKPVMYIGS